MGVWYQDFHQAATPTALLRRWIVKSPWKGAFQVVAGQSDARGDEVGKWTYRKKDDQMRTAAIHFLLEDSGHRMGISDEDVRKLLGED